MDNEVFFQRAVKAIKANATYSQRDNSWTIGVVQLRMIFDDLLQGEAPQMRSSYFLILEEGARRGFWKVDDDHDYVADLVVLRQLIGSK